ncbi:MAG: PD40 domain-containing protein, partial [Magnetococcales bacterium]|nr:PD40 domain-containing protein [Magnetococcales bacterium]
MPTTTRISIANDGTQGNRHSGNPSVSADGQFVAFYSVASNLVTNDTNGSADVFLYDTTAQTIQRISIDNNGTQGNGDSYSPSVSADGQFVAFSSKASNLVANDTNGSADVFLYDTTAQTIQRISIDNNGTQGNGHSHKPVVSADGQFVAFESFASNLVANDT